MADPDFLLRLRDALESQDVAAFSALLAPGVTWGAPDDPNPPCRNRRQVVQWYQRGLDRGVSAVVSEVTSVGHRVLVGLIVTGNPDGDPAAPFQRWQVLALADGRVRDIRGFEDRPSALAYASKATA